MIDNSFGEFQKLSLPEIKELKERLEKIENQLEKEIKSEEEKEQLMKQEIKDYFEELHKQSPFVPSLSDQDEAKEIASFEPNQQIGALINLVFQKGLPKAISVVRALNNPALLDEFHDILVDYYFEILVKKRILKL